jgi:hypothetical protein
MISKKFALAMCAASATLLAAPAVVSAQELKAEREENVTYYRVEMVKFHHGKRPRAAEIVDKYFAPADRDLGGTVIDLHLMTGDWDFITMFPMSGGPADLSYTTSPDDVRWMTALRKRAGGVEAAQKLVDEWDTLVAKREWQVAHIHNAPK